jgi:hypothetical protein
LLELIRKVILITHFTRYRVYKRPMHLRRLISSGLLLAVLLAPVLGVAACMSASVTTKSRCAAHCAMKHSHPGEGNWSHAGLQHRPAPTSPCCERKLPTPILNESSAQVVAPVQLVLMPAVSVITTPTATAKFRRAHMGTPPRFADPFSLLCTLQI